MFNNFRFMTAGILVFYVLTTHAQLAEALTSPSEPKPVVAVFEIKTRNMALSDSTIGILSSYLGSRLTAGGRYSVAPGSSIREAMTHMKIDSQRDCYDDACRIELGRAAAAHKYLNTLVWKVDKLCSITIDLYDLRTEASEVSIEIPNVNCSESGLKDGIAKAAFELGERELELPKQSTQNSESAFFPGEGRGHLHILSEPPGAAISLSGKPTDKVTPYLFEFIETGEYSIVLHGANSVTNGIANVTADNITKVQMKLNQESLTLDTNPTGLPLMLDNQSIGIAPQFVKAIEPGHHHVKVEGKWGINAYSVRIDNGEPVRTDVRGRMPNNFPLGSSVSVQVDGGHRYSYQLEYGKQKTFIEWIGMNLGGGYIPDAEIFGKIDVFLFSIAGQHWYYTVLDWGILPFYGTCGVGGRFGYQKSLGSGWVLRTGLKFGFELWDEKYKDHDDGYSEASHLGVGITPHIQFIKFFEHASVGFGIDVLILIDVIGHGNEIEGEQKLHAVAGSPLFYLRWSAF